MNANERQSDDKRLSPNRVDSRPLADLRPSADFFPPRPPATTKIYAYADTNPQYAGLLKIGYTTKSAKERLEEIYPVKMPGKPPYRIVLEEPAMRQDCTVFTDNDFHRMLRINGIKNPQGELFR